MTLLQSTQTGRRVNVLENYVIQLFQHNNMNVNKKSRCTATSHMPLETRHTPHPTLHSLPSTKYTDRSETFPP